MTGEDREIGQYAREVLGHTGAEFPEISPLAKGGSERTFRRIRYSHGRSVIFMHYNPDREENRYYATIAGFLRDAGLAVPAILHHDPVRCFLLMEDLGDTDLWSFRQSPWPLRRGYYEQALRMIHRLHRVPVEDADRRAVPRMEGFGPALYRWERDYFRENFVRGICGIEPEAVEAKALEAELDALAVRLEQAGTSLVHRDFQSQNILIHNKATFFIDFQGMRTGSLFYDLGSLLYDPYAAIDRGERLALLRFYYGLEERRACDWETFQTFFHEAAAQRLMQALGAYGFLGLRRNRKDFLVHIPAGLARLSEAVSQATRLPLLRSLTARCRTALETTPSIRRRHANEEEGGH